MISNLVDRSTANRGVGDIAVSASGEYCDLLLKHPMEEILSRLRDAALRSPGIISALDLAEFEEDEEESFDD